MSSSASGSASKPQPAAGKPAPSRWQQIEPFVLGGASGMAATCVIQPMDMVKVRIQLAGEGGKAAVSSNPIAVARTIIAQDGFMSLYTGLSAGLLRQATYTTARLGIFRSITNYLEQGGRKTTFMEKAVGGLVAGGLGSIVGTPADVALIRMQADGTLPVDQRRNYTGVFNALTRITREEGVGGMFKGCGPVVVRAMALNVGMLASHDQALDSLKQYTDNKWIPQVGAKLCSGFFASAFSLPFDFVKTRIQKQKPDANGVLPYKNSMDCVAKVIKQEGPTAFYRGFVTYYARIAPHVMITLVVYDALKAALS
jgi:solute carrier family 25 oxoglutarate transporter 11